MMLRPAARIAQALLRALEVSFELLQASVRAQAPPVELGSKQGSPVPVIVDVCLKLPDLAGAHAVTPGYSPRARASSLSALPMAAG